MTQTLYEQAGVASDKSHVKQAFLEINENEYPYAFVNITTDFWDPNWVMSMHLDGSGSRSVTHWLYFLETGDDTLLPNDIADAIAMNADIVAGGFTDGLVFTDVIGINTKNINESVLLTSVAKGIDETMSLLTYHGFHVIEKNRIIKRVGFLGGETASLVDQQNSYDINVGVFSRMPREGVIAGNVQVGDIIWGFSSGGQAIWEDRPNSGHMSNGSTLSNTALLWRGYQQKYPFLRSAKNAFRGSFTVNAQVRDLGMTIGEALLSPTRQWAIVMKMIIEAAKNDGCFDKLHAIVMNTGGGLTKCKHVGRGIRYQKTIPYFLPIFELIQTVTKETTLGMMKTFNCGIGLEVIGDNTDNRLGKIVFDVCAKTKIPTFTLGTCLPTQDPAGKNEVVIEYKDKEYGPNWG